MEDRSGLFSEIGTFSQRNLKKVQTKLVTGTGETLVEKRGAKGLQTTSGPEKNSSNASAQGQPAKKLDLQVGLVIPGLMIGSHDAAQHRPTLEEYGVTHILNLASNQVDCLFEEDLNYLPLDICDEPSTILEKYFDEAFDFIDDGKHRGNVLVHCDSSRPGLSRTTSICVAYLMTRQKVRFTDAYNEVKEARSLTKPNDGFMKQLLQLDDQLFGTKKKDDIEDPFTLRKRQEIEAEKAQLKNAVKMKDRLAMFAAQNSSRDSGDRVPSPSAGSVRSKWSGPEVASEKKQFVPVYKNEDGSMAQKVKLTSIISLFSKPKEDGVPSGGAGGGDPAQPLFPKSSAPVRKWKTVEPPPPPGRVQVKRNKSRRWLHDPQTATTVRRNKSKANFGEAVKKTKSREFKVQASSDKQVSVDVEPVSAENVVPSAAEKRTAFKKAKSRSKGSLEKSVDSAKPPVAKAPVTAPPEPSTVVPESPETAVFTPWRRQSSMAGEQQFPPPPPPPPPKTGPVYDVKVTQLSTRANSPTLKSGLRADPVPDARAKSQSPTAPPPPPEPKHVPVVVAPPPPPPPAPKMVFGKVKPKPMKITGSSISFSDDTRRPSEPEPVRVVQIAPQPPPPPPPVVKPRSPPPPPVMGKPPSPQSRPDLKKAVSIVESSSEEESEEEEKDEEEQEPAKMPPGRKLEERRTSDTKGLNRSSTMEILKLIKSKTGANLAEPELETLDEDEEIDDLLNGLEEEGIDNIDWGELGIDLGEVKDIVETHKNDDEDEESETESDEEEDEETEEDEEEEEDDEPMAQFTIARPSVMNSSTYVVSKPAQELEVEEEEESD
ncbi:Dual specificity protein phosphatase 19 [Halotydeus destructor]|nr:Dual specificity protein phosphatase 19 [Halotydeus destructor]